MGELAAGRRRRVLPDVELGETTETGAELTHADILIVEDNPSDMKLVLHAMRAQHRNLQVTVVRDGEAALDYLMCRGQFAQLAGAMPPRLVLLDLKIPKINGFQVLAEVRKQPGTRLIPIVVLTSSNQTEDILKAYELGANSYVQKPVDFDALSNVILGLVAYWMGINLVPANQRRQALGESQA